MTDERNRKAAVRQQLPATSRLVVAEEPRQAASAAVDWLRAEPAVEAAAVVLTSGTKVTHRVCRSDDASWCDRLLERLDRDASGSCAPPPAGRVQRGTDEASPHVVHVYPPRTEHRSFGTMRIGSFRDEVAGDESEVTRRMLARALASRLESLEQLSRLRREPTPSG